MNHQNRHQGYEAAAHSALERLRGVDLARRCADLGLPGPRPDGSIILRAFGRDLELAPPDFDMVDVTTRETRHVFERILVLRYLGHEGPLKPSGELISFRDLPSGMFYWGPFRERSAAMLEKRIGNDTDLLRTRLDRFDWESYHAGDLGAVIHAVGAIRLYLIYRRGDEEFPPSAEILFDSVLRRVYSGEDAAVLAQRICAGLVSDL